MRTTNTIRTSGINYVPVKVECLIESGIGIHLVGLADLAVKESLLRTVTAMQACGYRIPGKKIVINLAPADLAKSGSGYDLPIALSVLAESGQRKIEHLEEVVVIGELGLDGSVRAVPGVVQAVQAAVDAGLGAIIPRENAAEVAGLFGEDARIWPVRTLNDAIEVANTLEGESVEDASEEDERGWWDKIAGNAGAKRAMEIAAAGGHHMLMIGPNGTGKAFLAKAMLDILPAMGQDELLEVAKMYSVAGKVASRHRPFRSPHYAASMAAWFGGGASDRLVPGEVSLSSGGVLYVGDFNQVPKAVKEALRGPMEDGKIVISRLKSKVEFPSRFQLVLSEQPCPCGWYGEGDRCQCTKERREAWLAKLGGPVIDMIDVQVWVHPEKPGADVVGEPAEVVAERVAAAREMQMARQGKLNASLKASELPGLSEECKDLVERLMDSMGLSARAYSRTLKIARTIADLAGSDEIKPQHIAEASSYRFLDRRNN